MNLKPADEWLLKEKVNGKFINESLKKQKAAALIVLNDDDIAKIGLEKTEIIESFNLVFAVLAEHGVYLKADIGLAEHGLENKILIVRIGENYAKNRARNLKDKISDEYRNLIAQTYKSRYKSNMIPKNTHSIIHIKEFINHNPIETPPEDTKLDRKGLEDRGGTRIAAKG